MKSSETRAKLLDWVELAGSVYESEDDFSDLLKAHEKMLTKETILETWSRARLPTQTMQDLDEWLREKGLTE